MNEWLTAEEVAEYLRVPLGTLYVWRTRKRGPAALRIGKHLRYRRVDVERWLRDLARAQGAA